MEKLLLATLDFSYRWQAIRSKIFITVFRRAFSRIGSKTTILHPFRFGGPQRISIGDRVYIGHGSWLQAINPREPGDKIVIEDRVSISGYSTITAAKQVLIEENALIAKNVHISDHIHRYDDKTRPIRDQGITGIDPVRIGSGCWIGQGVVITPGTVIGKNSVIGANSVVKGEIPPYCVAVGAPARVVRQI